MIETFYANRVDVIELETEIALDFHFRTGIKGQHTRQCRVVMPWPVAARLGLLLQQDATDGDNGTEAT